MLRISVIEEASAATLKVEGKVVGPWAAELGRTWHALCAPVMEKRLLLDIRGLTFADQNGSQVLGEIVSGTGAEIIADSPLTRYFASKAASGLAVNSEEK